MNEAMKQAWLEISQMMGETTPAELDVFLRTWQRAIQAEREACADIAENWNCNGSPRVGVAAQIRARGQA
jgi:hypothetical protein